jgi:drug/metabolite transporter (DMT)-like permease
MSLVRVFDAVFVNQLFQTDGNGSAIFTPNGAGGRGYFVPPEREGDIKSGIRRLAMLALLGAFVFAVVLPRAVEGWFEMTIPLCWFIAYAVLALVIGFVLIIKALARLTAGLQPVSTP